ncbi:MAG: T9SS type A sorting domain-containing protein [Chitinophagaceae bacterium]|nr:MAG: T9SS type A sorting domain-containing protein [Chitinophagaceae bacterium]
MSVSLFSARCSCPCRGSLSRCLGGVHRNKLLTALYRNKTCYMKKYLLTCLTMLCAALLYGQTTYYWVGGTAAGGVNMTTASSWNTALNGTGTTRPSATGATDILVFDGSNIGGATQATGQAIVHINGGITCGQLKFINGANVTFTRVTGTGTINVTGGAGEDFVIEGGSTVGLTTNGGSTVIALAAVCTGTVSGTFSMITNLQARIANTTGGSPGSLVFKSGSKFTSNITSASSAYPFGNSTQSSEQWVVFESGAHYYYEGGFSPMGSATTGNFFMPIDFRPGSYFHMKASNPTSGSGTFFNRKSYPNVIVENGATLTSDGSINRIDTLIIAPGSSFVTHTSGQTVILGDLDVNGSLTAPATSTNELVLAGNVPQTISGIGTLTVPSFTVSDDAQVTLARNVTVNNAVNIYGQLNFGTNTIGGSATFTARRPVSSFSGSGNTTAGTFLIRGATGTTGLTKGVSISGPGITAGTRVVSVTSNLDSIWVSRPLTATATGVALTFSGRGATLATSNVNGFDAVAGSVAVSDTRNYQDGISYEINAATTQPFGISTTPAAVLQIRNATFNAAATTNATADISGTLTLNNGKLTLRPGDVLQILPGATIGGSIGSGNYIVTSTDVTSGSRGVLRQNGLASATLFPVGSATNYLPATLTPSATSDFSVSVFEGITQNGTPNGTPLTLQERQTVVNAVWDIAQNSGTGASAVKLQWVNALEGSVFTTFANSEIGTITNSGSGWSAPIGTGDNTANTAENSFTTFGAFSLGARPPANPFLFNAIPDKNYGDADFTAGVLSANSSVAVQYTSSNPAVATVSSSGQIHIVGVGTTSIRATQASDGFYPAADVTNSLTVNKAPLTIQADNLSRPEGDPNPTFTVTYTGFVNGENSSVLTTQPVLSTTATVNSLPGTYPIQVSGATAENYTITMVNGVLTVSPRSAQTITFAAIPAKTYGAADFALGASSTNLTIPIQFASSDPSVATVTGNTVHITGAGTTTITANQPGSPFFFPATAQSQVLTVNKANLTVRAFDTTRMQGEANPDFRYTITGYVLGQTAANLTSAPAPTTTATSTSSPGYYPITFTPGASNNYNFVYTNARLAVLPPTGADADHLQAYVSASGQLRVRVYNAKPDLADVVIYDMQGRPLMRRNVFLQQGFTTAEFNTTRLQAGIYIVRVYGKQTLLTKNVLIGK